MPDSEFAVSLADSYTADEPRLGSAIWQIPDLVSFAVNLPPSTHDARLRGYADAAVVAPPCVSISPLRRTRVSRDSSRVRD